MNHNEQKFDAAGNLTDARTRHHLAKWLESSWNGSRKSRDGQDQIATPVAAVRIDLIAAA